MIRRARAAAEKYNELFVSTLPFDPCRALERHGYIWSGEAWIYNPDEAQRRGQQVDYGRKS
jgi:hypothetical protein